MRTSEKSQCTTIPLHDLVNENDMFLKIKTRKAPNSPHIQTTASVYQSKSAEQFGCLWETHKVFHDFNQLLQRITCKRVTQQKINWAHLEAETLIPEVIESVIAHYQKIEETK